MIQHLAENCRCSRDCFEHLGAALGSDGVLRVPALLHVSAMAHAGMWDTALGQPHTLLTAALLSLSLPGCSPPPRTLRHRQGSRAPLSPQGAGSSPCQSDRTQFPFSVSQARSWGCAQARCLQGEVSCWEQSLPLGWGDYSDL